MLFYKEDMPVFKLTLSSPTQTFTYNSTETTVVIGRSLNCSFSIPKEDLSREHCLLEMKGNDIYLTDLSSSNGVTINKVRVKPETPTLVTSSSLIILSNVYLLKLNSSDVKTLVDAVFLSRRMPEFKIDLDSNAKDIELEKDQEKSKKYLLSRAKRKSQTSSVNSSWSESIKMIVGFIIIFAAMLYHVLGT